MKNRKSIINYITGVTAIMGIGGSIALGAAQSNSHANHILPVKSNIHEGHGAHHIEQDPHAGHNMSSENMDHMEHSHELVHRDPENRDLKKFSKSLLLPPVLTGEVKNGIREFNLEAVKGSWEFIPGFPTETWGYSSPILGPVLSLKRGEPAKIKVKNNLDEMTTVHWHGAVVGEAVDGVHNSEILPGKFRTVDFTLNQPAATLWFHPHTHYKTASQVYKGMAGLLYLEDEISAKLPIPKEYGVDDFPIVVQEKILDEKNQLLYKPDNMQTLHGKIGGYMMVNGIIAPYANVPSGIIRLRVVNGSNATRYNYDFGGVTFYKIASDGGFLEAPIPIENIILSPGERAELLVDTSKSGKKFYMNVNRNKALELRVSGKGKIKTVPKNLVKVEPVTEAMINSASRIREFDLSTENSENLINNKKYDMNKTDFDVKAGTYEIWKISNKEGGINMPHPFHIHGAQFRILKRNGAIPSAYELGWKDTVNLDAGENVEIIIKFENDGMTVYHCHILEHEESGMMGQFKVNRH